MKAHIAASARRAGKTGDEYNRYVYGALRARGWKPKKKLQEVYATDYVPHHPPEPVVARTIQKLMKQTHKEVKKEVFRPSKSVFRALRQRQQALQIRHDRSERAATMLRRSNKVLKYHVPNLTAAGAAYPVGFMVPVPGAGEMAAVGASKGMKWLRKGKLKESVNAVMRQNTDTNYAYNAARGSRDVSFKHPANTRRGYNRFNTSEQLVDRAFKWLDEMDDSFGPHSSTSIDPFAYGVKKIWRKGKKEFKHEVTLPYRKSKMAVRSLRKAGFKSGHASVQRRRALSVLKYRTPPLAAGVSGAVAGTLIPGPQAGGILMNTAMPAKAMSFVLRKSRERRRK